MSMSYAASRVSPKSGESEYYMAKAISLVNEHLADPKQQASDSTIATVSCLANIEESITAFEIVLRLIVNRISMGRVQAR